MEKQIKLFLVEKNLHPHRDQRQHQRQHQRQRQRQHHQYCILNLVLMIVLTQMRQIAQEVAHQMKTGSAAQITYILPQRQPIVLKI